ncbi:MAG: DEAD/DEAH box helicase [Bdellovibrionota bacterium]
MYSINQLDRIGKKKQIQITKKDVELARELLDNDQVGIEEIFSTGVIKGFVYFSKSNKEVPCTLYAKDVSTFIPFEENLPHSFHLAILLKVIKLLSARKKTKSQKRILANLPIYLSHPEKLKLKFHGDEEDGQVNFVFDDIRDLVTLFTLESYGEKIEEKYGISTNLLASHLLAIYPNAPKNILVEGMQALVRRFVSAEKENIQVDEVPINHKFFGYYRVLNEYKEQKPYDIFLSGNKGLEGSCSCPDYQNSTLRWCKHLSAVYMDWHRGPRVAKKFSEEADLNLPLLGWLPPVSLSGYVDPLLGLWVNKDFIDSSHHLILSLLSYFADDGKMILSKIDSLSSRQKFLILIQDCAVSLTERQLILEPAVETLVQKELDEMSWPLEFSKIRKRVISNLDTLNFKLYSYQREGVERALSRGRFLLGDEMGLGKTVQGVAFAECLLKDGQVGRALLICPSALKDQWCKEWKSISNRDVTVVAGSPEERGQIYRSDSQVFIINYELLLRDLETLHELDFDLVLVDEAQRFKNYDTETSRRIKTLQPNFRLILTGTPMENRIEELVSLLDWIKPAALGPYWRVGAEIQLIDDENGERKGVKNLSAIRDRIQPLFLRRTRSEVLNDLPSRSDAAISVPISEEQKDIHDAFAVRVLRFMKISEVRPLTPDEHIRLMALLTKMRIVSNGIAQLEFDSFWPDFKDQEHPEKHFESMFMPKLQEFRRLVEGLITQEVKIVVFSQWQRMLKLCHWAVSDLLDEAGLEAVFFTGRENQRKRAVNIRLFHEDKNVKLFFATDAGGVGVNLQRAANICINLELPWNPAVLEQRIGRIYRIGQKHPIQIFNLISAGCIEERISSLISQKKAVFDALFDGVSDGVHFDKKDGFYQKVKEVVANDIPIMDVDGLDSGEGEDSYDGIPIDDIDDDLNFQDQEEKAPNKEFSTKANEKHKDLFDVKTKGSTSFIDEVFKDVKVEISDGKFKLEANAEAAQMMAQMFGMMGKMFEQAGRT